jgi:hypothetical protein
MSAVILTTDNGNDNGLGGLPPAPYHLMEATV